MIFFVIYLIWYHKFYYKSWSIIVTVFVIVYDNLLMWTERLLFTIKSVTTDESSDEIKTG